MTASLHIQFYLNKLLNIDKGLQGTTATQKKVGDDFTILKGSIHKLLFQLRSKIEQKTKYANVQRNVDSIKIDIEIKNLITDIESLLDKLNETLRKQYKDKKNYTEQTIQNNKKIYSNYRQQLYDLQYQLDPNVIIDQQQTNNLKIKLMDQDDRKPPSSQQLTQEEKDVIKRLEQNDQEIDQQLYIIVDGTQKLKENAQQIGQKIDQTTYQIDNLINEVDETNQELNIQKNKLKRIVVKYRQPNKFCLDMVLIFILIGLCSVIYVILN